MKENKYNKFVLTNKERMKARERIAFRINEIDDLWIDINNLIGDAYARGLKELKGGLKE